MAPPRPPGNVAPLARRPSSSQVERTAPDVRAGTPTAITGEESDVSQTDAQDDLTAQSPEELLDAWRGLVEECGNGYEYNVMEYHADLEVRDRLERCLRSPGRTDAAFAAQVAAVDEQFRALLQPGVEVGPAEDPWWHRGVPRYAGDALAEGMREWFGVEIESRG